MKALSKFSTNFKSEFTTIKSVLKDVMSFVSSSLPFLQIEQMREIKLIFSELLVNAVIHGNKCDASKTVRVYIEITDETIFFNIQDEGEGFNYEDMISKFNNDSNNLFNESGRGIMLVYELSDSMFFNSLGNEINILKKVTS